MLVLILYGIFLTEAFLPLRYRHGHRKKLGKLAQESDSSKKDAALDEAIRLMTGGGAGSTETPQQIQDRIKGMVEENDVLLFMKGTKSFPQCGFSDTATKILERLVGNEKYYAVDVLSDNNVREGVKLYSQWPTIPQLYVRGEFVGGSDIMVEMFESGELKELIKSETSD